MCIYCPQPTEQLFYRRFRLIQKHLFVFCKAFMPAICKYVNHILWVTRKSTPASWALKLFYLHNIAIYVWIHGSPQKPWNLTYHIVSLVIYLYNQWWYLWKVGGKNRLSSTGGMLGRLRFHCFRYINYLRTDVMKNNNSGGVSEEPEKH